MTGFQYSVYISRLFKKRLSSRKSLYTHRRSAPIYIYINSFTGFKGSLLFQTLNKKAIFHWNLYQTNKWKYYKKRYKDWMGCCAQKKDTTASFLKQYLTALTGHIYPQRNEWEGAKLMSIVLLNLTSFEF